MEMTEYHDSYMYVSCTVSYIMTAILNFKMADKLTYIQIMLYIMFWNPLASQTLCITTIICNHSVMLKISCYISIIDVCYINMTAIWTTNQPIPDLIADNIFRILSIKNVGKATNYFKTLVKSLLTGNA